MNQREQSQDLYVLFATNTVLDKPDALMIWEAIPTQTKITQSIAYFSEFQSIRWTNFRIVHLTLNYVKTAYKILETMEC